MATNLYNISQVLGISIVHSLWQGMLIYMVLRGIFYAAPSLSSLKKYYLGVFAMAAVLALFVYTLVLEIGAFNWSGTKHIQLVQLLPGISLTAKPALASDYYSRLAPYMPYICTIYLLGLFYQLAKLGWNWRQVRLVRKTAIYAEQMQQFIFGFSKKLGISRRIELKFSEAIDVPCVVGHLKPLILLPVSLSTHLSACEVESILLHELAHIKRNDYLVNLLQQAISVIFFFNPFSRLINRIISQERENSCDDLVIAKTGKPLIYARALLKLETARNESLQLALAATGKKFYLLNRIERIMKTQQQQGHMRHFFITLLLLAGGICCIAWFNPVYAKIKADKTTKVAYTSPLNTIAITDTTDDYAAFADTSKHKTKHAKTLVKRHRVVKKSPDSEAYHYSDDTSAYFQSPEWKSQMAAIKKQAEELKKQFNSPGWKAQQEQWKKMGEQMSKQFNSPEWKAQMETIKKQTLAMQKQFNSPEWKAQQEQLRNMAENMGKQFSSPEWKAQMETIKKQAEELKKQFNSPEWKAQQEQWRKQFDNPEWKAHWKKQAEEWKKQFNTKEWQQQREQWKKMGEEMGKQFDNKAWKDSLKNQKWMWKDSVGGTKIYKPAPKDSVRQ